MKVVVTRTLKRIVKIKYEHGQLNILANYFVSQKKLLQYIQNNSAWIASQKIQNNCEKSTNLVACPYYEPSLNNGDILSYSYEICCYKKTLVLGEIVDVSFHNCPKTVLDEKTLFISNKNGQSKQQKQKAIYAYLRKLCNSIVANEIAQFGTKISLCPRKIHFCQIDGEQWLKCDNATLQEICLDFRIAQLPVELRRYVIAHAFCHFYNVQHDDSFYKCLANYVHGYNALALKMKNYSFLKDV